MSSPIPIGRGLLQALAQTLGDLAIETEGFGVVLCSDADIAARHLDQLQKIDRIAQSLREVQRILETTNPEAAVDDVRLGELRSYLEQARAA